MVVGSQSYDRGYNTGLTWDNNWTPGGPWHSRCRREQCDICDKSEQERIDWLHGFDDGIKKRDENQSG